MMCARIYVCVYVCMYECIFAYVHENIVNRKVSTKNETDEIVTILERKNEGREKDETKIARVMSLFCYMYI